MQSPPPEVLYEDELRFLEAWDPARRPKGFRMTAAAVVMFVMGSGGDALVLPKGAKGTKRLVISPKFVGSRALVERLREDDASIRKILASEPTPI